MSLLSCLPGLPFVTRAAPRLTAVVLLALFAGTSGAHQESANKGVVPPGGPAGAGAPVAGSAGPGRDTAYASDVSAPGTRDARTYFTDTELLTQDGRKVRFYSDVLQDKVVLINVIYTSCKDACPLITRQLTEVRARLGERFGKDVYFISLTSDPERDTPAALKKFAAKNDAAQAGWTFLTGSRDNVQRVLARLGQLSQNVEEHSTLLIAGNVGAKRWSKIRPDAPVTAIAERLKLLADGGSGGAKAATGVVTGGVR